MPRRTTRDRALTLAPRFGLDVDAVTGTAAFIGIRGSGKTYTAKKLVEQIVLAGFQAVTVDPLDAWWGLQSSADGRSAGLDVIVFGGSHADVPLEPDSGILLADLVVDEGINAVLSLRHLSKAAMRRFVLAFAVRLYERKGAPEHRTPVHLSIDEADLFVPQRVMGEVAAVHGAIDDIVRRGRSSGLGVSLITQRPAVISKDVLTQCEILFAHRTVGVQDRKALEAWISAHDVDDQAETFMQSLSSLATGEVWAWAPLLDVFRRVKIGRSETFDSSATPKAGKRQLQPKARAEVDLDAIREKMSAVVERAEANDPRKLRVQVERLTRELLDAKRPVEIVESVEVPVVPDGLLDAMQHVEGVLREGLAAFVKAMKAAVAAADESTRTGGGTAQRAGVNRGSVEAGSLPLPAPKFPVHPAPSQTSDGNGGIRLGGRERRILSTLVTHGPKTQRELAAFTGYSAKASTIGAGLTALRKAGLVESNGSVVRALDGAQKALGAVEALPSGPALLDYWRAKLGKRERVILDVLLGWYPSAGSLNAIANATGYSAEASTIGAGMSALRRFGLVDGWRISDEFAEAIR